MLQNLLVQSGIVVEKANKKAKLKITHSLGNSLPTLPTERIRLLVKEVQKFGGVIFKKRKRVKRWCCFFFVLLNVVKLN